MEDCVSKNALETIKKLYQALLLAEKRLADMVCGSEDQWGEDKLKWTRDGINELCKKYTWLCELGRGYLVQT